MALLLISHFGLKFAQWFEYLAYFAGPATVLLDMQGVTGCLDPVLYTWLSYVPRIRLNAPSTPTPGSVPVDPQGSQGAGASTRENAIGRDAVMSPVSNVSKGTLYAILVFLSFFCCHSIFNSRQIQTALRINSDKVELLYTL